jgi:multidrug efflux pump subunit AcrA (membrane-fusion protein)
LYSVIYALPEDLTDKVADREYISVSIPVGKPDSSISVPFLPLDSIYQTQDHAYILVIKEDKAVSQEVVTGEVFGRFVQIEEGLNDGDRVILNRNVVSGDSVVTL